MERPFGALVVDELLGDGVLYDDMYLDRRNEGFDADDSFGILDGAGEGDSNAISVTQAGAQVFGQ